MKLQDEKTQSALLTDGKLQSELVLGWFVGTIEGDLDLELLSSTDDEIVRVVQRGMVLQLVDLIRLFHHVHIPNIKILWEDRWRTKDTERAVSGSDQVLANSSRFCYKSEQMQICLIGKIKWFITARRLVSVSDFSKNPSVTSVPHTHTFVAVGCHLAVL